MLMRTPLILGETIAGFTVKEYLGYFIKDSNVDKRHYYLCECKCGKQTIIDEYLLKTVTNNQMLGCKECKHKMYILKNTYRDIKYRCYREKSDMYPNYGGRGIKVCDRWLESFNNFVEDMGFKPSKNHSIERLNVNEDYCPENCIWLLNKLQSRNRTTTILNQEIVHKIKKLKALGLHSKDCYSQLVDTYPQITKMAVWRVYKGLTWKDIDVN